MRVLALCTALLAASAAAAHDKAGHGAAGHDEAGHGAAPLTVGLPLPLNIGGPFRLTDQHGLTRTEAHPAGQMQLLFFGYANCEQICSAVLPQMAGITAGLLARGVAITPVMITVDPVRDTTATMTTALAKISQDFIGLTGDAAALQTAYDLFAVESEQLFIDPQTGPVYAHGSFMYLLDGEGGFLTLIPPILSDDRAMDIIAGYAANG